MSKRLENRIINLLENSNPLTLKEIAEKLDETEKNVFKVLRRLAKKEELDFYYDEGTYYTREELRALPS